MAKRSTKKRATKSHRKSGKNKKMPGRLWHLLRRLTFWGLLSAIVGAVVLDVLVVGKFEGKKWELPAHVYSRSLELYEGLQIEPGQLAWELKKLGYKAMGKPYAPGQYKLSGNHMEIHSRGFRFWDKDEPARKMLLNFRSGQLNQLRQREGALSVARLEPLRIGGIYHEHREDRELVRLGDLPDHLVAALLSVEDRAFYDHHGISFRGLARAMLTNIKTGRFSQGGSTITQQLVKNFYLTQDRKLWRKLVEIPMAMLLELHYDKDEILETYINEVYLGQSGRRGIHGFALASRHYFQQPISELQLHQVALLAGLVKGASYYDPRRHPERALQRRNLVIDVLAEVGEIDKKTASRFKQKGLGLTSNSVSRFNDYPDYLSLVKRQLLADYRVEDLSREGLRVFTNFDPQVQRRLEQSIANRLKNLEQGYRVEAGKLQAASVVTRVGSGEVVAVAGGRTAGYAGFNRALDARRPVGSTIKPAIYLTALEQPSQYSLASLLDDSALSVTTDDGTLWQPKNFERKEFGKVPLYEALGHSYNLSTARLGLDLGLGTVVDTLRRLGFERDIVERPSLLLGAVDMSPFEVAGIYHTIAADGFYSPLRSIRAVYTAENYPLKRYPYEVEQRFNSDAVHLLQYAMQVVVREGTGKRVYKQIPQEMMVAGKTGTSNGQRDSWFAGFSGSYLSVVWMGRDDNGKTPLTGGTGALRLWGDLMKGIPNDSMIFRRPENVNYVWVDDQGLLSAENCPGARYLPFVKGFEPTLPGSCNQRTNQRPQKSLKKWFKDLFR